MIRPIKRPISKLKKEVPFSLGIDVTEFNSPEDVVLYCQQNNLVNGNTLDIEALIETHPNLTLVYKDLGKNDAYIKKLANDQYEIGINKNRVRTRQRFSMAHELAHYALHRKHIDDQGIGEKMIYRNDDTNLRERQANSFAAETLMSELHFINSIRKTNGKIVKMSNDMKVSMEAIKYRASSLGYKIND